MSDYEVKGQMRSLIWEQDLKSSSSHLYHYCSEETSSPGLLLGSVPDFRGILSNIVQLVFLNTSHKKDNRE